MKLNRPAILASISLLTLGGLYYGFFRSGFEGTDSPQVCHESKASPVWIRPAEHAGVSTPSFPDKAPPESVSSEPEDSAVRPGSSGSAVNPSGVPATPEARAIAAGHQADRSAPASATQVADRGDRPAPAPVGIRLAPDVRLPVAALPNDLNLNPIKQKVLQNIIDEYYQTLAAAVPSQKTDTAETPADSTQTAGELIVEENGDETVVIQNSPAVDAARKRADQRFKAIFGDAAYMRMTQNTLLESRLSPVATEP